MDIAGHFEFLDALFPGSEWEKIDMVEVINALCKTYRDAVGAFELLSREGVILSTPHGHYRWVPPAAGPVPNEH